MELDGFLFEVPEKLFATAESFHVSGKTEQVEIATTSDTYVLDAPLEWEADVTNTGGALLVSGVAKAQVTTACGRCLENASYDLEGSVEGFFVIPGEGAEETLDEEEDEFEILPENHVIDFEPLVVSSLFLELPVVPLCQEDCLGLCPECGSNLNEGPCGCQQEEKVQLGANNPFGALAGLKFD